MGNSVPAPARRQVLAGLAGLATWALLAAHPRRAAAQAFDLSPEQRGREHAQPDPQAVAAIPHGFAFALPGVLTVASDPGGPPLNTYATDTRTIVGADPDIAALIAESLGLKLNIVPTNWADWPLALQSGKVDAVISNVGVTEERKLKYDFSTYRLGIHGFFVQNDSRVARIAEPKDIAGLRVVVGAGTNQDRILSRWNDLNHQAGLPPATLIYFDDEATRLLALRAKRADVIVQPHAQLVFIAARDKDFREVGTLSAGWPDRSDVAVTTRKGSGLAAPVSIAVNRLIQSGAYLRTLQRWHVETEALESSEVNPPGLPRF